MSIILHLARAELGRLRWWFLAWCAIQSLGFLALFYSGPEDSVFYRLALSQDVLTSIWAFFFGLDLWLWAAPQGAERFWATRPISLGQLLWSRLIVITLILVLAPLCLCVPFWVSWNLEPVQYWTAIGSILSFNLGSLGAAFLVCLVNPYMGPRNNRFLQALLTVFLIGVVVALVGFWFAKQQLLRAIPYTVRDGMVLVAPLAFLLALAVLFVRRSRALALSVLCLLLCLSLPLLYLLPVRSQPFPDSPKAIAALGGLQDLEFVRLPAPSTDYTISALRSDASAGPLHLSIKEAALVQEGNRVPVLGNWITPRLNMRSNDLSFFDAGERRLKGSLLYDDGLQKGYPAPYESPLRLLIADKPVTFQGRFIVTQLEQRKRRELLIAADGSQTGSEGLHLRRVSKRGPETVEVYTDFRPHIYSRDGDISFRAVDALSGERIRERRSSGYHKFPVLGVEWISYQTTFSSPLKGAAESATAYRIIEYAEYRRDLGFATIEVPMTIDRPESALVAPAVVQGEK